MMYRQGDVLLVKATEEEAKALEGAEQVQPDKKGRLILAEGESTGHAHAVPAIAATLWAAEALTLLQVNESTQLVHEEHSAHDLEPGVYKVIGQREYSQTENRRVLD